MSNKDLYRHSYHPPRYILGKRVVEDKTVVSVPDCWIYEEPYGLFVLMQGSCDGQAGDVYEYRIPWRRIRGILARKDKRS